MDRTTHAPWILALIGILGIGLLGLAVFVLMGPDGKGPRPQPEETITAASPPPEPGPVAPADHDAQLRLEPLSPPPPTPTASSAARKPLSLEPTSDGSVRLEGRLHDEINGRPVTLFKVWCVPIERGPIKEYARLHPTHGVRRRDIQGRFVLPYLKPGAYNILIQAASYEDYLLENVSLPHEGPLDLMLSRGAHIEGRVIDMSGQAVSGIQVHLNVKELYDNAPPPRVRIRETDRAGHFLFTKLPTGRYSLSAMSRAANETPEFIVQERQRIERDIVLTIQNALRVMVTDPAGRVLPNASVRLWVQGTSRNASTDYTGSARIRYVPGGNYSLKVSRRGYKTHRDQITIQNYGDQDLRVMLEPERDRGG